MLPPSDDPLHDFPDRSIRSTLEDRQNLRSLIAEVLPDLVDRFDFEHLEAVPNTFLLDDWRKRESDLLFRLPFQAGEELPPALVCLLVEHQSEADPWMPLRILVYAVLYWERQWKAWEAERPRRAGFRLSPIVPIIFHSGSPPWRTHRVLADLIGGPEELRSFVPRWEPLFWDLAEEDTQALLASASEWLVALAVVRSESEQDAAAFHEVFAAVMERLKGLSGTDPVRWHGLIWFVLSWGLRRRPSAETEALLAVAQSSQTNARRRQEVRKMGETILQTRDQEMLVQGQLREARESLRMLLEERFGELPETLVQGIEATDDLQQLRTTFRRALRAPALSDLGI
jgi:hypothetical protein